MYIYIYHIQHNIMYTKDIMDTINIIYNTYKHKTLKTHPKKPKVTDTIQAARTITKPDAPDKKITSWRREKKTLTTVIKKREGAKRQHTHTHERYYAPPHPPTPPKPPPRNPPPQNPPQTPKPPPRRAAQKIQAQ